MSPKFYSLQMNVEAELIASSNDVWTVLVFANLAHLANEENQ